MLTGVSTAANCSSNQAGAFMSTTGRCLVVLYDTGRSYFSARAECIRRGGDLAQLKSSEDNLAAMNYLNSTGYCTSGASAMQCKFWFGLTKTTWGWESGESLVINSPNCSYIYIYIFYIYILYIYIIYIYIYILTEMNRP